MLETSWLWFVISKEYVELTRPKIESRDPIFFTGTRSRSRVSGNDRLFPRGSEFRPNLEIPAGPAIQLRPGPGYNQRPNISVGPPPVYPVLNQCCQSCNDKIRSNCRTFQDMNRFNWNWHTHFLTLMRVFPLILTSRWRGLIATDISFDFVPGSTLTETTTSSIVCHHSPHGAVHFTIPLLSSKSVMISKWLSRIKREKHENHSSHYGFLFRLLCSSSRWSPNVFFFCLSAFVMQSLDGIRAVLDCFTTSIRSQAYM